MDDGVCMQIIKKDKKLVECIISSLFYVPTFFYILVIVCNYVFMGPFCIHKPIGKYILKNVHVVASIRVVNINPGQYYVHIQKCFLPRKKIYNIHEILSN